MQTASARLEKLSAQTFGEKRRKHKMKTNKSRKRLCSALLCLILTVSMLPITGYAGEGKDEATGGSAVQYPIEINEANFPDDNFRQYVSENIDKEDNSGNKDEKLSQEEIESVTFLSTSGFLTEEEGKKIKSLKGIEYFTSLNSLTVHYHNLSSLDVSKLINLTFLNLEGNQLTKIDVSNNTKLKTLYCHYNQLTWIDITNLKKLDSFLCGDNKYSILLGEDNVFNIDRLPQGFNVSKASNWQNGSLSDDKTKLTVSDGSKKVTYTYDCGNGKTAKFSLVPTYGITVQNDDHGKVTASIASANVTSAAAGKKVTLDAIPDEGYQFKAWEIVSGNITINDNKFTMPANPVTVKAIFEQKKYAVTMQTDGNGTASASVASVKVTAAAKDEVVTLTAAPSDGYEFKAWEIVPGNITINDNQFTMPANPVTVKAIFEQKKYAITVQTEGNGTASVNFTSAAKDEVVTLTAAPSEGYEFKEWQVISGNITINDNKFTMPASEVTIKASFKKKAASGGSSGGGAYVPSTPAAPSNPKPSGSAITSDVSGSTSRKDGETSTKVDQSTADKLVDAAIDNKSTDIVIDTASKTENGGCQTSKLLRSRCRRRRSRTSPKRPLRASPSRRMSARSSWITRRRRPFPSRGKISARRASRKPSVSSRKKSKRIPRKCAMSWRSRTPAARRSLTSGAAQPRSLCRFQADCREKASSASISTKKGIITK